MKYPHTKLPAEPTKAEIDDPYPLHLNSRSQCNESVAGQARSNQSVQSKEEKVRLGVAWMGDYAFMSGEHNEGEHGMQPALVLYDDDQDSVWAVGIDAKGATEAMVQYGVGTIE